jgi:chromosome segregation ATPase
VALNERIDKLCQKLEELDEKHEAATSDIKAIQRKLGEQGQRAAPPKIVEEVKDITAQSAPPEQWAAFIQYQGEMAKAAQKEAMEQAEKDKAEAQSAAAERTVAARAAAETAGEAFNQANKRKKRCTCRIRACT